MFSRNVKRNQLNKSGFCTLKEVVQFSVLHWVHSECQDILCGCLFVGFSVLPSPVQMTPSAFCPAHLCCASQCGSRQLPYLPQRFYHLKWRVKAFGQIQQAESEKRDRKAQYLVPGWAEAWHFQAPSPAAMSGESTDVADGCSAEPCIGMQDSGLLTPRWACFLLHTAPCQQNVSKPKKQIELVYFHVVYMDKPS